MVTPRIYQYLAMVYLMVTPTARAIQVQLSMSYAGLLAADGTTPINSVLNPITGLPDQNEPGSIHQYEVLMALHEFGDNDHLQSLQFDVVLAPGVTPAPSGGWLANNPQYDSGGPSGTQPLFSVNTDGGTGANDLHTIVVLVDSSAASAALEPGESELFYLGSARLQWDGTYSDLNGLLGLQANGDLPWGIYRDGTTVAFDRTMFTIDAHVSWSDQPPAFDPPVSPTPGSPPAVFGTNLNTPEPGSGLLAGLR
jgi:hypothetical protein